MLRLNLPPADLKISRQNNKEYVFDRLRKQQVRLTPEEWVRQHFIHYLIDQKHYPEGLLANEVCIALGPVNRRCDTALYDTFLQPLMIIEYKAPAVNITQKTFDQIMRYNHCLKVPWLIVSNGLQHYCCRIDENGNGVFIADIPEWQALGAESR
ncbi:MAG: type I restriction enzyme HsdR N-terminal domain-containing protein [Dysgonamonadaceae bacterium]|jgi:type I site-specific restriction-modification system R (restriction) subunit|nr:type I restriction enzyme HsdR N-terminal domain-containing protein [Dysgonamonadaceae bacterium]